MIDVRSPMRDDNSKGASMRTTILIFQLPFRLVWDLVVIVASVSLTITWLGLVFGSTVGIIILLVFCPSALLLPMGLCSLLVNPWPSE